MNHTVHGLVKPLEHVLTCPLPSAIDTEKVAQAIDASYWIGVTMTLGLCVLALLAKKLYNIFSAYMETRMTAVIPLDRVIARARKQLGI
ncbi:hypothetical protein [uncultured Paraglaciecola sp.]|uniref:hypothetical protein n=1 Tax=uncultured Paraglaciecola sp. TaxID=1765024 RepID=UPI0026337706|nr:hypothetical protein [uncultured Paraglaciecola sp.]